jgi:ABC-type multidrug transport system fused ATPase/permease subunit
VALVGASGSGKSTLAMVQQEITLDGMTIGNNLHMWRQDLSDEHLLVACREAQLLELIQWLPDGLSTRLSERGRNLSGGQRQRLEIAGALLRDPTILILDEASSALDADTEARLEEALRRRACTQIVVAHRLSTVQDADLILVLERGRVVQRGRHEELLAETGGAYAALLAEGES